MIILNVIYTLDIASYPVPSPYALTAKLVIQNNNAMQS